MQKTSVRHRTSRRIRSLGQHMLVSEEIANKIVDASDVNSNDTVLEIGTGSGMITGKLASRVKNVRSYEVDEQLFLEARSSFSRIPNLEIILGDAFDSKFNEEFDVCVTSLPYSQSLKFAKWLCIRSGKFHHAVAVLQSEFAQKLVAEPGKDSYRAVSVMSQLSFKIERLFSIGREAFDPQPRVTSEAVRFYPRNELGKLEMDETKIRLLNFLFSFRGRHASSALKKINKNSIFRIASIEVLNKRVENLSLEEFSFLLKGIERNQV
ncbi:MAG: 16S rRNA (adenine(1518)-N(6)/adenine(1519)-N(6))-dimethyltransferase RsmA [Thaumarchaeota archaeon]|nr:16S rRNA (adenine(1518)-N(6)/adenine(1519)-N(6))-dimethyltransferase RsmA [Nitrososphaerota archaeon]